MSQGQKTSLNCRSAYFSFTCSVLALSICSFHVLISHSSLWSIPIFGLFIEANKAVYLLQGCERFIQRWAKLHTLRFIHTSTYIFWTQTIDLVCVCVCVQSGVLIMDGGPNAVWEQTSVWILLPQTAITITLETVTQTRSCSTLHTHRQKQCDMPSSLKTNPPWSSVHAMVFDKFIHLFHFWAAYHFHLQNIKLELKNCVRHQMTHVE